MYYSLSASIAHRNQLLIPVNTRVGQVLEIHTKPLLGMKADNCDYQKTQLLGFDI
jgi:hypothetical protein